MNRREHNRAIAYLVSVIRREQGFPQWDQPGVEAILGQLDDRPLATVAVAAIVAAATRPDQRAPAVIAASGPHWANAPSRPTNQPPRHQPTPGRRLPAERTAAYAQLARAAARTTTPQQETQP